MRTLARVALNFGIGMAKALALSVVALIAAIAVIWVTTKLAEANARPLCSVYLERTLRNDAELVAYDASFAIGHLNYRLLDEQNAIITSVRVHPGYRTQGISKALIYGMLQRSPKIQSVAGLLVSTNFEATGLLGRRGSISSTECEEAARRTPFYRGLARFGFTRIVECEFDPLIEVLRLEVSR